jgi:hypothetical protein
MKRISYEDRLAAQATASIIFNLILWISGVVLISMAYQSWEVGLGVGAFLLFMKGGK